MSDDENDLADEPCPFCGRLTLRRNERWRSVAECTNPDCDSNQ